MASESSEITRWLKAHGLRPTAPRLALLTFLKVKAEHLTPAEIFEGLREAGKPVSIATLYQNLQALSKRGLVKRIAGPDGAVRYDVNLAPHHHLVCQRCGKLVDVELSAPLAVQPVVTHRGAPSQGSGAGLTGWQLLSAQVEFRGLCPQCCRSGRRGRSPSSPRG